MQDFYGENNTQGQITLPDFTVTGNDIYAPDTLADFDYLKNNYPKFSKRIQQAYNAGIPKEQIETFFREYVEPRVNYVATPEQADIIFGRTQESKQKVADYERARMVNNYKLAFPDKSDEDIDNAIALSEFSGVQTTTLLQNPELAKTLMRNRPMTENPIESGWRGMKNYLITNQTGRNGAKGLFGNISVEEMHRLNDKAREKLIEEPINPSFLNKTIAGAAGVTTQGTKNFLEGQFVGTGVGVAAGTAAGLFTGGAGFGPAYAVGNKLGMSATVAMNLFTDQAGNDFDEFTRMVDADGNPMDENAARCAAILTGLITTGIEFMALERTWQLLGFRGGISRETVIDAIKNNGAVREVFAQVGKDYAKNVSLSTIHNVAESLNHDLGRNLAVKISGQQFPLIEAKEIISNMLETTFTSIRDFSAAGLPALATRATKIALQARQYQQARAMLAQQLGLTEEDVERAGLEAIFGTEEEVAQQEENNIAETQTEQNEQQEQTETINETPTPAPVIEEAPAALAENVEEQSTPGEESEQVQTTETLENSTPEITDAQEQQKPTIVFIPREQFEAFKAEHEEFANIEEIIVDKEVGISTEQFEQIRQSNPEFSMAIADNVRYGVDGTTPAEAQEKLLATDQDKASFYHSEENQKMIQHVADDFIEAGETQEKAETIGEVVGAINASLAKEGVKLTNITVKNVEQDAKQLLEVLTVKNKDIDFTVKNPIEGVENLRIFTFHEDNGLKTPEHYNDGDLLVETNGEVVGKLENGKITHGKRGYNMRFSWEALEKALQEEIDTDEEIQDTPQSENPEYEYTNEHGEPIAFTTWRYGRAFINLVKKGNFAAHIHEIGHVTFNLMANLAESGSVQMKEDFETILRHAEVTYESWAADKTNKKGGAREKAHEYFSKAFELYLSEGKAPVEKLQKVFTRVRNFLLEVYDDITKQLGVVIDDEVRAVFDRLFAMDADENTNTVDYVLENYRVENQIKAYEEQLRTLEKTRAEMTSTEEEQEEALTMELDPAAIEAVDQWIQEADHYHSIEEEQAAEKEAIDQVVAMIQELGGIKYDEHFKSLTGDHAIDLYRKWRRLFGKKGLALPVDEIATYLGRQSYGVEMGLLESGYPSELIKWLDDNSYISKVEHNSATPFSKVDTNLVNALLSRLGVNGTLEYLQAREKRIKKRLKDNIISKEDYDAEHAEIKAWKKSLTPVLNADLDLDLLNVEQIPYEPPSREYMIDTAYKLGVGEANATAELEAQIAKEQAKVELAEAVQAQKEKDSEQLERKKAKWEERAEKRIAKLKEAREADKAKSKARLETIRQRMKEKSTEKRDKAVAREAEKWQKRISKIQKRVDNLRNYIRTKEEKRGVKRMVKGIFGMSKSKWISVQQQREIQKLLDSYELAPRKADRDKNDLIRNYLLDNGEQYTQDYLEQNNLTMDDVNEYLSKIHVEDMKVQEVAGLYSRVKSMYEQGRREFAVWKQQKQNGRLALKNRLTNIILATTKEPPKRTISERQDLTHQYKMGRVGHAARVYWNSVQTPGRFLKSLGDAFRVILDDNFGRLRGEAQRNIYRRKTNMEQKLRELGGFIIQKDFIRPAITLDGKTFTWSEAMGVYLAMKNPYSAAAVLWGNFVQNAADKSKVYETEEAGIKAINKILGLFTENPKMKQAAELIIKDFDENFERIREASVRDFNQDINKQEFYTPIFRLRHQTAQGIIDAQIEEAIRNGNTQAILQKMDDGFTISRLKINPQNQQPINLDVWANWLQGMRQQEFRTALGGYATDVMSALLIRGENGSVQELIKSRKGTSDWNTLTSIFNDSISDKNYEETDAGHSVINIVTHARSIAYIPFRPSIMAAQFSSYFLGMKYAGFKHTLRSTANFLTLAQQGRLNEFLENVYEKSPELRVTGGDPLYNAWREELELNRSSIQNPKLRGAVNGYMRLMSKGFEGVRIIDNWTKSLIFDAAYNGYIEQGMSEEKAISMAERVVHDTQPASTKREMTRLNRAQSLRFLTQFTGALAPVFNMAFVDVAHNLAHPSWNAVKASAASLLAVAVSVAYTQFAKDLFNGELFTVKDEDDEDEFNPIRWTINSIMDGVSSSLPIFSSVINSIGTINEYGSYRNNENPIADPFIAFYRAIDYFGNEKYEGERTGDAVIETIRGLALIGVPVPYSAIRSLARWFMPPDRD